MGQIRQKRVKSGRLVEIYQIYTSFDSEFCRRLKFKIIWDQIRSLNVQRLSSNFINPPHQSTFDKVHYFSIEVTLEFFFRIHSISQIYLYLYHKYTKDSLDISRVNDKFTICFVDSWFFANSLWIHYLFRDFTMKSLYFSRIHYGLIFDFANSL